MRGQGVAPALASLPCCGSAELDAGSGGVGIAIWLIGQLLSIPLLIHHGHRPLRAMEHSRKLFQANRLKVLALLGLLLGINLLGLMAASLGLLFSLPFSALLLMASRRTQTPWRRESRENILPT